MEDFEKIDWLPTPNDVIDEKFVDVARLQNESSMYRILNGNFKDPFAEYRIFNNGTQRKGRNNKMQTSESPKKGRRKRTNN